MSLVKLIATNAIAYGILYGVADMFIPLPAWTRSPVAWFLLGVAIAVSVIYQRERLSRRGTEAPGLPPSQS